MLVSPTERDLLPLLSGRAISHSLPEQHGADVLVVAPGKGRLAIQRKTFPDDLLASLEDGRLAREIALLSQAQCPVLIVEGQPQWTADGHLMVPRANRWTQVQLRNLLRSVWWVHGIAIEYTASIEDTAKAVLEMESWFRKEVHRSLLTRPKRVSRDSWRTSSQRDFALFFLQGLPGVGSVLAEAILERFGRIPMSWTCSLDDLKTVDGIGDKRARALWELLQ